MKKYIIPIVALIIVLVACGKSENKSNESCCSKIETDSCKTADTGMPDASIFNSAGNFTTQDNKAFDLTMLSGKPTGTGHGIYAFVIRLSAFNSRHVVNSRFTEKTRG